MEPRIIFRKGTDGETQAAFQIFCGGYFDHEVGYGYTEEEALMDLMEKMQYNVIYAQERYDEAVMLKAADDIRRYVK